MIDDILVEMTGRGFLVELGPHSPDLLGYFARFFTVDYTGEDDEDEGACWAECGHGITLLEALQMAQQLALGQFSGPVPDDTEFIP